MKILLDTHIFLWATAFPKELSPETKKLLTSPTLEEIQLSSISIWEICKLVQKERIFLNEPLDQWLKTAIAHPKLVVVPVSTEIAIESCNLPGTFHADPADQIIVATARLEKAILMTQDKKIRAYPHVTCA